MGGPIWEVQWGGIPYCEMKSGIDYLTEILRWLHGKSTMNESMYFLLNNGGLFSLSC